MATKPAKKSAPARKRATAASIISSEIPTPSMQPYIPVQRTERADRFDWRSLYLYAVCLITLMVCLFSLVSLVRNGVNAIFPDAGYIDPISQPNVSKADLLLSHANQLHQNRRNALMSLVDSFTTILIAGPLYLYHWRMVRK